MGEYIFVVTILTLFMFFWIEIFRSWYIKFLTQRGVTPETIRAMLLILWVILAIVFWFTLLHRGMPTEFTIGHFAFALFIFSLFNLVRTLVSRKKSSE